MKHEITLKVNGQARRLTVESQQTLLDVLVEEFHLPRTKEGCGMGECGSCGVSVDKKLVSSCLLLAAEADGKDVVTMERLVDEPGFNVMMEAFIHPDQGALRTSAAAPGTQDSTGVFTYCHICGAHCSVKAIVEGGHVVDMEPDLESGFPSEQCAFKKGRFTIPEVLGHRDRLLYPMKRVGARGEGKWRRISWDEALDTVASKLNELKRTLGPESVAFGLGEPKGMEFAFGQRLASAFGTPSVVTPGWLCGVAKGMAAGFTYGGGAYCDDDTPPALLVIWGANIVHSMGASRRETLEKILESGGKLAVIDPQKTYVAKLADLWIRIRPGSDGALAAGVLKVIVEEGLYDKSVVEQWTVGFESLKQELSAFSLDDVERISWVPKRQIEQLARLYGGTRPAAVITGNSLDQHVNSFQTLRAIAILRGICGNINVLGGEVFLNHAPFTRPGNFYLLSKYPRDTGKLLGDRFKFAQKSTSIPSHVWAKAVLEEDPYPIKATVFVLSNPLITYPDSEETYRALMKLDFIAVSELFMTPTAHMADIVLPAAWGMEHDELGYWAGWYEEIRSYPKLAEPPGECWADNKIINELAKRLGLKDDFWSDEHEALDAMLAPSGMSYEEFKPKRVLGPKKEYRPHHYRTPSRKIEIYSEELAKLGYEPLPRWSELSRASDTSPEYPLLLTNAKEEAYMASAFRHVSSVRIMRPDPIVELHPDTAGRLGLEEGKWVHIETEKGRIRQKLSLNRNLDPRVVIAAFGWWFPEQSPDCGWRESNINMLTANGPSYDPSTGGVPLRGLACKVYAA